MEDKKIPLLVVVGPTASGKTSLGVRLAKTLSGEVISADSMQIYRDMPIASAVPTPEEKEGVPHHLMEFLDAGEEFSVADYVNCAREKIIEINSRDKLPILVGGTGLYVNSIVDNIEFGAQQTSACVREKLENEMEKIGAEAMLARLEEIDPQTAARLHPNNRRRIIRALEVYETTGKTLTELNEESRQVPSPFDTVMIGVTCRDREKLYDRINKRVDIMLESGLLDEAQKFHSRENKGAGQAIGHKEFAPYFSGECSLEETVETLKRETRRYAKRQLTWFLRDSRINWIYIDECEDVAAEALKIIRRAQNEG